MNTKHSDTPRTDADNRAYPSPEYAQRIRFEGNECVVMAPEEYEALYEHARQLERENAALKNEANFISARAEKLIVSGAESLLAENAALKAYVFEMESALRGARASGSACGESLARAECAQLRYALQQARAAHAAGGMK